MSRPKKIPAVSEAEARVATCSAAVQAARESLKRLEAELQAAAVALQTARIEADAGLARARLVAVKWRTGGEEDRGFLIIVKKTPGGQLVCRPVGAPELAEQLRFKQSQLSNRYVQAWKSTSFASDRMELRDVPPQFLSDPQEGDNA